jgi:hypothetical protein
MMHNLRQQFLLLATWTTVDSFFMESFSRTIISVLLASHLPGLACISHDALLELKLGA